MTAAALFIAFLAVAEAVSGEPGLKPPPAATPPAAVQPLPQDTDTEPAFYLMPAHAVARVAEVIEMQKREIERLRAIIDKGSCS